MEGDGGVEEQGSRGFGSSSPFARNSSPFSSFPSANSHSKCKSIGISNYGVHHIKEMDSYATIKPAINQLELHPFLARKEIVAECHKRGIAVEPWGSLTRGGSSFDRVLILPAIKC